MSFLNPVNEPVLRFKSTDVGAPQINYAARAAGDVKAVLKACLVDGYGGIASAGWSVVNEVGNSCDFVAPSATMSDYKLVFKDDSAAYSIWFYSYRGVVFEPTGANTNKTNPSVIGSHGSNGWELIATERGFVFIENVFSTALNSIGSNAVYWGEVKSAINDVTAKNIAWWTIGINSNASHPSEFFGQANKVDRYFVLADQAGVSDMAGVLTLVNHSASVTKKSNIELSSEWFYLSEKNVIAQQPAVLLQSKGDTSSVYEQKEVQVSGRTVLSVWTVSTVSNTTTMLNNSHAIINIYLDYWEY